MDKFDKMSQKNPDLAPYIEQLKKAGVSDTFGTKKEVKQLPQVMRENEIISFATSGFIDGDTVLIVITNFRLFFLNNGMIFGKKFTEFPLDKITDLTYSQKLLLANVSFSSGFSRVEVKNIIKKDAPILVDKIKSSILKNKSVTADINDTSIADELKKFKELLDLGAITQEEFEIQKAKLLK
ncbi:hypothetical protein EFL48_03005 [Lactococcus cremoris]|uniref:PH domain-containing protein n=1 Tax=Lactococcus lactis subsp. cremoris TaxID=1359 RepID=UPI00223B0CD7|nr:PH domain-containing protein [Lactococcus cremoris]MCT0497945.1 hypothetical protein [Lactococcus cremoris]